MNEFKTIRSFFDFLNKNCDYLVLRNWDNIFDDCLYGDGHEDIDILCRDVASFVKLTNAKRIHRSPYRDNFVVEIGCMTVRFDVRHVGDGYYPAMWEKSMLNSKILTEQNIYVMNAEDYAYSLSFHALIQKPTLSEEYKKKITDAFGLIGMNRIDMGKNDILILLLNFCKKNRYFIEIPSDPGVYLNRQNMSEFECSKNFIRRLRRDNLRVIQIILSIFSKIKNLLKHKTLNSN